MDRSLVRADDEKLSALEKRKAEIKAQQLRVNRQLRAQSFSDTRPRNNPTSQG